MCHKKFFKTAIDYPVQNRPGYKLYVFDLKSQQEYATPQSLEVKFEFKRSVAARDLSCG